MILWTRTPTRHDASYAHQGGVFASVYEREGQWWVEWWVGPVGTYRAPSEAKARLWVERFARTRLDSLSLATVGSQSGPSAAVGYVSLPTTPEQQARYDAFSAKYVPPKRPNRKRR